MHLLAAASFDWFEILKMLWGAAISYFILRMGQSQRRSERAEDERTRQMQVADAQRSAQMQAMKGELDGATAKLHETATKLVDERFRAMTHEINGHVNQFVLTLEEMKQKLKDSQDDVDGLGNSTQQIQLGVAAKFENFKDWFRDNAATKEDLKEHERNAAQKFLTLGDKVEQLGKTVAVLGDRMETKARANQR